MKNGKNHEGKSMMILTVIAHGCGEQWLYPAKHKMKKIELENGELEIDWEKEKAWHIPTLIEELSKIDSLIGQPKVLFLDACRGGKYILYLIRWLFLHVSN